MIICYFARVNMIMLIKFNYAEVPWMIYSNLYLAKKELHIRHKNGVIIQRQNSYVTRAAPPGQCRLAGSSYR